jgi:sugar lactone lactonase YvrE
MKYGNIISLMSAIIFFACQARNSLPDQSAFTLSVDPMVVEGMTGHAASRTLYFGDCMSQKIFAYSLEGNAINVIDAAKYGAKSLLGAKVEASGKEIWVVGSYSGEAGIKPCVFNFDLTTGALLGCYLSKDSLAAFNDLVITDNGTVYVTDHVHGGVHVVHRADKTITRFLFSPELQNANGIDTDGHYLFVSTGNGFVRIDPEKREILVLPFSDYRIAGNDGLYYYNHTLIGIQNVFYPQTISQFFLNAGKNAIDSAAILYADPNAREIPTTGVIIDDEFWFMKNTNLLSLDFRTGTVLDSAKIRPVEVLRVKLP